MFIDLQNLNNLENILTRLARSTCRNTNVKTIVFRQYLRYSKDTIISLIEYKLKI